MRKLTKVTELCELEHLPRAFLPRSPPPALLEGSYCPFGQKALSGLSSFAFNTGMLFITSLANLSQIPLFRLGIHCPLPPEPLPRQLYLCLPSGSTKIFIQL